MWGLEWSPLRENFCGIFSVCESLAGVDLIFQFVSLLSGRCGFDFIAIATLCHIIVASLSLDIFFGRF